MREQIYSYRARASFAISSAERAVCKNIIFRCIYILIVYFEDTAQKKKPCFRMASFSAVRAAACAVSRQTREGCGAADIFAEISIYKSSAGNGPALRVSAANLPTLGRCVVQPRGVFRCRAALEKLCFALSFGCPCAAILSALEPSRLAIHILYDYIEYLAES